MTVSSSYTLAILSMPLVVQALSEDVRPLSLATESFVASAAKPQSRQLETASCVRVFSLDDGPVVADCSDENAVCTLFGSFSLIQNDGVELAEEDCPTGIPCFGGPGTLTAECSRTNGNCEMNCCWETSVPCTFTGGSLPEVHCPSVTDNINKRNGVDNTVCECEGLTFSCSSEDEETCYETPCANLFSQCIRLPISADFAQVCYIRELVTNWSCDANLNCALDSEARRYTFTKGVADVTTQAFVRIPASTEGSLDTCVNFYDDIECNSCEFCNGGAGFELDCSNIRAGSVWGGCISGLPVSALVSDLVAYSETTHPTPETDTPDPNAGRASISPETWMALTSSGATVELGSLTLIALPVAGTSAIWLIF